MFGHHARKSTAIVLLAVTAMMPIAACETIEKETGFGKTTQLGAAGGAAFGGIVAALAQANPAWIAASVIMGGIAGGALGDYLGKGNAQKHVETNLLALDTLGQGQSSSWTDNQTGNSGSTTVTRVFTGAKGQPCKSYTETVKTAQRTVTQEATACREAASGPWKIQTG